MKSSNWLRYNQQEQALFSELDSLIPFVENSANLYALFIWLSHCQRAGLITYYEYLCLIEEIKRVEGI